MIGAGLLLLVKRSSGGTFIDDISPVDFDTIGRRIGCDFGFGLGFDVIGLGGGGGGGDPVGLARGAGGCGCGIAAGMRRALWVVAVLAYYPHRQ